MERIQPGDVHDPGTYSQAIRAGNTVYLAGQIALDGRGELVGLGDVAAQAEQAWRNIGSLLSACGARYEDIVKATTYLVHPDDRAAVNAVRARHLGQHLPATTLITGVTLAHPEYLVEIDCTAVIE